MERANIVEKMTVKTIMNSNGSMKLQKTPSTDLLYLTFISLLSVR